MTRKLDLDPNKRCRAYSDARIAQALQFLSSSGMTATRAAQQLKIPRGTLTLWRRRYIKDEESAARIDRYIDQ